MLKKIAFANALTAITLILYGVTYIIGLISKGVFAFIFNAYFWGADVTSLIPTRLTITEFIGIPVVLAVVTWLSGYGLVWFYNYFAKKNK
jgi:hypothetical protein